MQNLLYNLPISGRVIQGIINTKTLSDALSLVESDASLALKVFYTVNSAQFHYYYYQQKGIHINYEGMDLGSKSYRSFLYKKTTPIVAIKDALLVLGVENLRLLAISSDIHPPEDRFFFAVNRHSYLFAEFLEYVIKNLSIKNLINDIDTLKTAATLHDIGKIVLYVGSQSSSSLYGYASNIWNTKEIRRHESEHKRIAYKMLKEIGFPKLISCIVKCQYGKCRCDLSSRETKLVTFFRVAHSIFTDTLHLINEDEKLVFQELCGYNTQMFQLSMIDFYHTITTHLEFLKFL